MDLDTLRFLLVCLPALPLVAACAIPFVGEAARRVSLAFVLAHLALTAAVVIPASEIITEADPERTAAIQPEVVPGATAENPHATTWDVTRISSDTDTNPVQLFFGLDGINIWLVALASVMMLPAVLASWGPIQKKANQFYAWMFVLQAAMLGVFLTFDLVLFYVCFELTLIPAFFLIGIWGESSGRREAARKFFLYTLAGSLLTLVGLVGVVLLAHHHTGTFTFAIPELVEQLRAEYASADGETATFWANAQYWLFLALVAGFVVKIPLVPLHNWLPDAYGEAPTGVTILLSAVMAKMGTFGLLRVVLPTCPDATLSLGIPVFGALAAIGIIYAAFVAYAQSDMKRMVAYSSVSHLGFCALAILAFNTEGVTGGVLHMVNHGLATGALFLLVGMLAERYGTTRTGEFGGLWNKLPTLTLFMFVVVLANIGVPALNNFVSEMLMLAGLFEMTEAGLAGYSFAVAAAFGIFMGAWYLLTMMQTAFFGPLNEPDGYGEKPTASGDVSGRELGGLLPLTALIVLLGCVPAPALDVIKPDAEALTELADEARERQSASD